MLNFASKKTRFKVKLQDGKKVDLEFRPFTLADLAWHQEFFPDQGIKIAIEGLKIESLCRIIWHQMHNDSRSVFFRIKYQRWNEDTGELYDTEPEGWERFCEAVIDMDSITDALDALMKCMIKNGFIEDGKPEKKKA